MAWDADPTGNPETRALVSALEAVNGQVPGVVKALLGETLSVEKEHQFGSLLFELGELLHTHADTRTPPVEQGSKQLRDGSENFDRHNQAVADLYTLWQDYQRSLATLKQHRPGRTTGWCVRCSTGWPCSVIRIQWQIVLPDQMEVVQDRDRGDHLLDD